MSLASILTALQVVLAFMLATLVAGYLIALGVSHAYAETCHTSCNVFGKFTQCTTVCDDE